MQSCLKEFNVLSADKFAIAKAGEELICQFYEKDADVPLNTLRYRIFQKKVAIATPAVAPEVLPPTSDAAVFHSYRTYLQTQVWKGKTLNPLESGFSI